MILENHGLEGQLTFRFKNRIVSRPQIQIETILKDLQSRN